MLSRRARLPHDIFTGKPLRRARFEFGNISFYQDKEPRAAVIVSKKVARSAVERNRIRRRVLHALKPLLSACQTSVVVYPTKAAQSAHFPELRDALAQAMSSR